LIASIIVASTVVLSASTLQISQSSHSQSTTLTILSRSPISATLTSSPPHTNLLLTQSVSSDPNAFAGLPPSTGSIGLVVGAVLGCLLLIILILFIIFRFGKRQTEKSTGEHEMVYETDGETFDYEDEAQDLSLEYLNPEGADMEDGFADMFGVNSFDELNAFSLFPE
jgi:hypothetical protein